MVLTYQSFESNHHKNEDQFEKNLSNPNPGFTDKCHCQCFNGRIFTSDGVVRFSAFDERTTIFVFMQVTKLLHMRCKRKRWSVNPFSLVP